MIDEPLDSAYKSQTLSTTDTIPCSKSYQEDISKCHT